MVSPSAEPPVFRLTQEREFYKYYNSRPTGPDLSSKSRICPPSIDGGPPRSSRDTALTAFAQLGALRLNARRATISLFDRCYQHILAEATRTLSLQDDTLHEPGDQLWLGCAVLPKENCICKYVALLPQKYPGEDDSVVEGGTAFVVPDLSKDDRFKDREFVKGYPSARFYAGVPIQSPKGITIGSYCILDDSPRESIDSASLQFMKDTATTIMNHLDLARLKDKHRRGERMIAGLGSFLERRATLRGSWRDAALQDPAMEQSELPEGGLNTQQQDLQNISDTLHGGRSGYRDTMNDLECEPSGRHKALNPAEELQKEQAATLQVKMSATPYGFKSNDKSTQSRLTAKAASAKHLSSDSLPTKMQRTFSRAANIIRESLEVEGVIFFDANIRSYGGLTQGTNQTDYSSFDSSASEPPVSSSEDNDPFPESGQPAVPMKTTVSVDETYSCETFGFSMTETSSINNDRIIEGKLSLSENFLKRLLCRYPQGKIFNFDENGAISSGDSSDDSSKPMGKAHSATPAARRAHQRTGRKRSRKPILKQDAETLIRIFPRARSIAFYPLWDSHRLRWFSGSFAWTNTPTRVFSAEDELTYLYAFGNSTMAEITRLDIEMADRAKVNLISSISHELRSPLHGINGTLELLSESSMKKIQHEMVRTIGCCSRTLLDIIDHLLDFTEAKTMTGSQAPWVSGRPNNPKSAIGYSNSNQNKSMRAMQSERTSVKSNTQLDVVLEEVVEAVYAGNSFCNLSNSMSQKSANAQPTANGYDFPRQSKKITCPINAPITIIVDIDRTCWSFDTQAGAWRRILMNLFGNALKYTNAGFISVKLSSSPVTNILKKQALTRGSISSGTNPTDIKSRVTLTITDTGKGISGEYLRNDLFTPFSQEDPFVPGNGLGLSIVQQAISSLGGEIEVKSVQAMGTVISAMVELSLPSKCSEQTDDELGSMTNVQEFTRGRAVGFIGFDTDPELQDEGTFLLRKALERMCKEWFNMETHPVHDSQNIPICHFYIATHAGEKALQRARCAAKDPSPVIVICDSFDTVQILTDSTQRHGALGITEFICQPCGPRKLAKAFEACIERLAQFTEGNVGEIEREAHALEPVTSPMPSLSTEKAESLMIPLTLSKLENLCVSQQASPTLGPDYTLTEIPSPNQVTVRRTMEEPILEVKKIDIGAPAALLVDDNDINLKLLAAYAKRRKYPYATATNGLEAYEAFKAAPRKFRVILMDISMPVMDGLTSTQEIRRLEQKLRNDITPQQEWRPALIIALTGLVSADVQQKALSSGVDIFLTKPVTFNQLNIILEKAMTPQTPAPRNL
ncbi:hypothetical protein GX50_07462 [[Emmonsia] crescens]|uniref:histidine kinase n=1 Tax=[Emmonsia] crescens TaxID=73230 RepID=A0A2B7Z8U4_9EURO|nr:hypothetical protein GX50_07462 [Emmonsia crescens]